MVTRSVVTLANSIVGVSVLAMPFCFQQCGIVLATLSLMMGAVMTRMVCYFLVKAAVMSRRRTYEMLAWSTFGQTGKFMVEISIIGFLIGTLIAFMVVIGDLGPEILSEIFSVENNSSLRTIIMTALSLFVALPLGLLRNIDSLSSVSTASVLFYLFLVLKIFSEGIGPLWSGEYLERIHFWRAGGVLQCIPIFSMALSCQTQIFGIYDTLPDPSLQKMNEIVKKAVNICTFFYFCVGFFGYIAFSNQNFGGNILLSFSNTWTTQLIKSMFLMSVVFSVPLVVFPCRASLHSLIFRSASAYHHVHDISTNYIPEARMKFLTVTIVGTTLVVGILIPNIELVLGLVGSTTGSVICIIFPSIMFVRVTSKNTTERLLAQFTFVVGVVLMLLTTYATLYAAEQSQIVEKIPEPLRVTENMMLLKPILHKDDIPINSPASKLKLDDVKRSSVHQVEFEHKFPDKHISSDNGRKVILPKREPPSQKQGFKESGAALGISSPRPVSKQSSGSNREPQAQVRNENVNNFEKLEDGKQRLDNKGPIKNDKVPQFIPDSQKQGEQTLDAIKRANEMNLESNKDQPKPPSPSSAKENPDLSKTKDVADGKDEKKEYVEKHVAEEFLKRLEEHQENQKKLLEEQKEILEELKQHHAQDIRDKMEKEKDLKDVPAPVEPGRNSQTLDNTKDNQQQSPKVSPSNLQPSIDSDKMIQEQEKIIEKISENLEKESKNVQLLKKLEEGLNKEVNKMDPETINSIVANPQVLDEKKSQGMLSSHKEVKQTNEKAEVHNNANFNDNIKSNQIHENENRLPNLNVKGDVLKNIDKEKGVLVGSLVANKYSDPPVEPKVKVDGVLEDGKNNVDQVQDKVEVKRAVESNQFSPKENNVEKEKGEESMRESNLPQNFNQHEYKESNNNNIKKEEIAPPDKKPPPVNVPKEKVDREI